MNDTIKKENSFKVGSDFELHTVKKSQISGKKECFPDSGHTEGEVCACKHKHEDEHQEGEYLQAFQFMNIGLYLVTPLLVGVLLGSFFDHEYHIRPIGTLLGILIGVIALFYNLYQLIKKSTYARNKH